jgi:hypothetical protein
MMNQGKESFHMVRGTMEKICQQPNECKELKIAAGQKKADSISPAFPLQAYFQF